ncbi:hemolysin III family protein [Caenimonas sedimenti]|uniref:Hemolysin III family protein n=2 Tax=Caenimonas sedimenti TaxID=2596921 RepID=A0A562ZU39_9BURK|nr:hemolysin III family protein [Caenimonas sedimenti]
MYKGERFNAWAHLVGLLLTLGFLVHAGAAASQADRVSALGVLVFLATAGAAYFASILAHSTRGEAQRRWVKLDHCAIFLLIAGSLTPFALSAPRQAENLVAMGLVWALAGIAFMRQLRAPAASPAVPHYLLLGWCAVLAAAPVAMRLSGPALDWLLAGAAFYSVGTVFYRNPRGWAHAHGVWHLFVVAGTSSHYAAVCHLA